MTPNVTKLLSRVTSTILQQILHVSSFLNLAVSTSQMQGYGGLLPVSQRRLHRLEPRRDRRLGGVQDGRVWVGSRVIKVLNKSKWIQRTPIIVTLVELAKVSLKPTVRVSDDFHYKKDLLGGKKTDTVADCNWNRCHHNRSFLYKSDP